MPIVVYFTDAGVVTEASGDCTASSSPPIAKITIQIGTPITEIPNFGWSAH